MNDEFYYYFETESERHALACKKRMDTFPPGLKYDSDHPIDFDHHRLLAVDVKVAVMEGYVTGRIAAGKSGVPESLNPAVETFIEEVSDSFARTLVRMYYYDANTISNIQSTFQEAMIDAFERGRKDAESEG